MTVYSSWVVRLGRVSEAGRISVAVDPPQSELLRLYSVYYLVDRTAQRRTANPDIGDASQAAVDLVTWLVM